MALSMASDMVAVCCPKARGHGFHQTISRNARKDSLASFNSFLSASSDFISFRFKVCESLLKLFIR